MGDFARYVLGSDTYGTALHTWTDGPDPFEDVRALAAERIELPQPLAERWWAATRFHHVDDRLWGNCPLWTERVFALDDRVDGFDYEGPRVPCRSAGSS